MQLKNMASVKERGYFNPGQEGKAGVIVMGGKYRSKKIKREHDIIDDITELLEEISTLKMVKSIIPGVINRRKGSGIQPCLRVKYNTQSGIKLLAKNSSSIQEIFLVTDHPEEVTGALQKMSFIE